VVVSSVPYIFFSLVRFVFDVLVNGVGWLIAAKAGIPGTFELARQTLGRTHLPPGRYINMSVLTNQVRGLDGVSRLAG